MYKIRLVTIIFSVILLFSLASCSGYAGDTSLGSQDQQVSQTAENVSVLSEEKDPELYASAYLAKENVYYITPLESKEFTEGTVIACSGRTEEGFYYVTCHTGDRSQCEYSWINVNNRCRITDTIRLKLPVKDSPERLLDESGAEYDSIISFDYKEFNYHGNGILECVMEVCCYNENRNPVTYSFEITWDKRGECVSAALIPVDKEAVSCIDDYIFPYDNTLIVIYRLLDGTLKTAIFNEDRDYSPKSSLVSRQIIEERPAFSTDEAVSMEDGIYILYPSDMEGTGTLIGKLNPYNLNLTGVKEISPLGGNQVSCIGVTDDDELIFGSQSGLQYCKAGMIGMPFMDYINSDLLISSACSILPVNGLDKFLCCYYDFDNVPRLVICDRLDRDLIEDSVVITMACMTLDDDILKRIMEFNNSDSGCRIVIKDYGIYDDPAARLSEDIFKGNMCDIICLDHMYDLDIYSASEKGLLADIGALIEADPDMNMKDFCSGVFDSARIDGKLYQIIPHFSISTMMGGSRTTAGYENWTVEEFIEYAGVVKEEGGSVFDRYMTCSEFLNTLMIMTGEEWVDTEELSCDFENPDFISLLDYALTLSEEVDHSNETIYEYWKFYEQTVFGGNIRIKQISVTDPVYALYAGYYSLYDKPVFTGFPSPEGNGSYISYYDNYILKADSLLKDEAWDFMRFLLLPGEDADNRYLPIRVDELEERVALCGAPLRYENSDGTYTESPMTYMYGGEIMEIPLLTEKEIKAYTDFILSVNRPAFTDEDIISIVIETFIDGKEHRRKAERIASDIQQAVLEYFDSIKSA